MQSVIIKGSPTSFCFLVTRKRIEAGLCNVASDWVDYCAIAIRKLRELADKCQLIRVMLAVTLRLHHDNYDCRQTHKLAILAFCLRDRSVKR